MTIRATAIAASIVIAVAAARVVSYAECIQPGRWLLDEGRAELVFSGNVVGINQVAEAGIRITFKVDRVWKGPVPKQFDLYVWQLDSEMPTFGFAERYVVFATKMATRSRQGVGLSERDAVAFRPVVCGSVDYNAAERAGLIRDLGPSRDPS